MAKIKTVFERLADHMDGLRKRQATMEEQVFAAPPKTMEEFNLRLGQWIEVSEEIKELGKTLRGTETEIDEAP